MSDKIVYRGYEADLSGLSQFSQNWIRHFASLDPAVQRMISFEPHDLRMTLEADMVGINTPAGLHVAGSDLFPQRSMYDGNTERPIFDPNYWNNNPRVLMANCYAHAMNVIVDPVHTSYYKLQPGEIYNRQIDMGTMASKPYREVAAMIGALAVYDIATTPSAFAGLADIRICSINDAPMLNRYRVALVAAARVGSSDFFDYHWYKECHDGSWSHKPGQTPAVDVDADGNPINAVNLPHQCGRNYPGVDYSYFVNYFMVTHL